MSCRGQSCPGQLVEQRGLLLWSPQHQKAALTRHHIPGLPDLANKMPDVQLNVNFTFGTSQWIFFYYMFQILNGPHLYYKKIVYCLSEIQINLGVLYLDFKYFVGHTYTEKVSFVCLNFKFNWDACIFYLARLPHSHTYA